MASHDLPLPNSPALPTSRSHLLVQRLYKHKVDHMIRDSTTALSKCTQCEEVFSASYRHKLNCEAGEGSRTDPLAAATRRHILDRNWNVQRQVSILLLVVYKNHLCINVVLYIYYILCSVYFPYTYKSHLCITYDQFYI